MPPARSASPSLAFAALLLLAAPAAAQPRGAAPVREMTDGALAAELGVARRAVSRCAARTGARAYLTDVRVRVRPGPRPSSMFNARVSVSVRSRPRDPRLEACVRRRVRGHLRGLAYAAPRPADAERTFRLEGRPDDVDPPPPRPFDAAQVRRALSARAPALQRCLGLAGVPERVTLRVAVEPSGRLELLHAALPPGVAADATPCLHAAVSRVRVRGAPRRRVELTHALALRR